MLFGISGSVAQTEPEPVPTAKLEVQEAAPEPEGMPGEPEEKEKTFEDLVKDFEVIEGFFTFYYKEDENKVWMEIAPPENKNSIPFFSVQSRYREAAHDGYFFDSSAMLARISMLFR